MKSLLYKHLVYNYKLQNTLYLTVILFGVLSFIGDFTPSISGSIFFHFLVITFGFVIAWETLKKWLQHKDKKNDESLVSAWEMISKREFDKARQKLNKPTYLNHYKHRKIFLEVIIDYYQREYKKSLAKLESIEKPELLSDPFLLTFHEHKGYNLKELQRYDEALEAFNFSIEAKDEIIPDHFIIYQHRGTCYHRLKSYEKAISDFEKSIQLKPIADTYHNKALSLFATNQLHNALDNFDRAIELDHKNPVFYFNRMKLHIHMQNWDKALSETYLNVGYLFRFWQVSVVHFKANSAVFCTPRMR